MDFLDQTITVKTALILTFSGVLFYFLIWPVLSWFLQGCLGWVLDRLWERRQK